MSSNNMDLKKLKDDLRDAVDEIAVQCMLIRNELSKTNLDKNKIISNIVTIEESIKEVG